MTHKKSLLSIGIDPSGCGTTGIYIKSKFLNYPRVWKTQLIANFPSEAFDKTLSFINEIKKTFEINIDIDVVVVEIPHKGKELFKEIKMTREFVGLLRNHFKSKFKGHIPSHKNKELTTNLINKFGKKNEHWIHARAILEAHFNEKTLKFKCENWKWVETNAC